MKSRNYPCTLENTWEPTMTLYTVEGDFAIFDLDVDLELCGRFIPGDESVGAHESIEDIELIGTPYFWDTEDLVHPLPADLLPYLTRWFARPEVQALAAERLLENLPESSDD
jgi:hypothetical protein